MSATSVTSEVLAYLAANFPGSTLDDGYSFVRIEAPVQHLVKEQARNDIAERMCADRCWIIAVGADPARRLAVIRRDVRSVTYSPDWNVELEYEEIIVEVNNVQVELESLIGPTLPTALVFISPERNVVFDANLRRIYAQSEDVLVGFADTYDLAHSWRTSE